MILVDTNILSELMRSRPEPRVVAWLDAQPWESIWTTSITVFEVRFSLDLLTHGRRRREMESAFLAALEEDFDNRVVVFDQVAADAAGKIAAEQRRAGQTLDFRDVQIAGIARARKATLATRNVRHFAGIGLDLVDPWAA
jgi:predicted nucleic acid-binding protein